MKITELTYDKSVDYAGRPVDPKDPLDPGKLYKKHWQILVKMIRLGFVSNVQSESKYTVKNPYTGVEATLNLLAYELYCWLVQPGQLEYGTSKNRMRLSEWRECLVLFRLCWPDEYFKLLD